LTLEESKKYRWKSEKVKNCWHLQFRGIRLPFGILNSFHWKMQNIVFYEKRTKYVLLLFLLHSTINGTHNSHTQFSIYKLLTSYWQSNRIPHTRSLLLLKYYSLLSLVVLLGVSVSNFTRSHWLYCVEEIIAGHILFVSHKILCSAFFNEKN
jgi:hypothetical protein